MVCSWSLKASGVQICVAYCELDCPNIQALCPGILGYIGSTISLIYLVFPGTLGAFLPQVSGPPRAFTAHAALPHDFGAAKRVMPSRCRR